MSVAVLLILFGWPTGILVGNLLASTLWVPLQWLGIHLKLRAHRRDLHARMDVQDQALEEIRNLLRGHRVPGCTCESPGPAAPASAVSGPTLLPG